MALHTLRNRGGSISYLVCGTLAPRARQRKARFSTLEDAIATQEAWEAERIGTRAALRPKITRLSQPQLAQAEAAFELLKGTNLSLVDAVRHAFRHPPTSIVPKKLGDALQEFLTERRPFIGDCHYENLRLIGEHMTRFLGPKTLIGDITTQNIVRWLESKGQVSKRTWNGYRNDAQTFFEWFCARPRQWITENPVKPVPQHKLARSSLPLGET